MKQLLKQYAWILGTCSALILLLLLVGCNQPPTSILESTQHQEHTQDTAVDDQEPIEHSTPNFDGIAHALGCVFAPGSCN